MKPEIHPTYYPESKVSCVCGKTWITGSTQPEIHTEICSNCHPFYTGDLQRLVDTEGQVDRFYKRLQARREYVDAKDAKEQALISPTRPIAELDLGKRGTDALLKAGITDVGEFMKKYNEGEKVVLAITGFGQKSLIDAKKALRAMGYDLSEVAEA
ncbi:MAG: 50S ribosomal protein L31 [Anaerolineae bacterium]|uniref:Large ribosomal subunit protein bL31 n=1 Tax=Candidatus Desulfolinea nitratireducens TaxID=2841698 RepID=A0A8J6NIS3_9CHLR|nr:50S ribosomal protein L31 [Candidatus Desulfolinea nitratireducens]MBL6960998.1 50S ribosomal protein L31 [Anaerolineales bacterium]NQU30440.1 50S ribosomal protein L31 [Anaerolineae bacterium]